MKAFQSFFIFVFFCIPLTLFSQSLKLPPTEPDSLAQLNSSPRHGEWVKVKAEGGDFVDLWVVYPERKEKAPVVLVVHEIFGLSNWVRAVADQLAEQGFIAIAPDFLSGKAPDGKGSASVTPDQARTLIATLKPEEIVSRLNAAAQYGKSIPASTGNFGIVGFCWGGGISFSYATIQKELKAAVVYYGVSPSNEALKTVSAPVLGLYGGNDSRVDATIPPAQEQLKKLGKRYEVEIYDGAGHAFLRQLDGQNGANLKAAQAAWPRTVNFLRENLEIKAKTSEKSNSNLSAFAVPLCTDDSCDDSCEESSNSIQTSFVTNNPN